MHPGCLRSSGCCQSLSWQGWMIFESDALGIGPGTDVIQLAAMDVLRTTAVDTVPKIPVHRSPDVDRVHCSHPAMQSCATFSAALARTPCCFKRLRSEHPLRADEEESRALSNMPMRKTWVSATMVMRADTGSVKETGGTAVKQD